MLANQPQTRLCEELSDEAIQTNQHITVGANLRVCPRQTPKSVIQPIIVILSERSEREDLKPANTHTSLRAKRSNPKPANQKNPPIELPRAICYNISISHKAHL